MNYEYRNNIGEVKRIMKDLSIQRSHPIWSHLHDPLEKAKV